MGRGEGKGWAKGLSAATDPRVARAAAAHRGLIYERQTPAELCRWRLSSSTRLPLVWSDAMAYVVGLTATDGCLITGRRRIDFKSGDRQLVDTYLATLGRTNRVRTEKTRKGVVFVTQFGDARLYEWLRAVGLTPRKSLTLGALDVPDSFLLPLARGLLDGDGTITNAVWRADTSRRSDYYYEWLRTRFVSASRAHLEWLRARLKASLGLRGWIVTERRENRPNLYFALGYGKQDSIRLLSALYADPTAPCLLRKRHIWEKYERRHDL